MKKLSQESVSILSEYFTKEFIENFKEMLDDNYNLSEIIYQIATLDCNWNPISIIGSEYQEYKSFPQEKDQIIALIVDIYMKEYRLTRLEKIEK